MSTLLSLTVRCGRLHHALCQPVQGWHRPLPSSCLNQQQAPFCESKVCEGTISISGDGNRQAVERTGQLCKPLQQHGGGGTQVGPLLHTLPSCCGDRPCVPTRATSILHCGLRCACWLRLCSPVSGYAGRWSRYQGPSLDKLLADGDIIYGFK